jgi:hypothetical protein
MMSPQRKKEGEKGEEGKINKIKTAGEDRKRGRSAVEVTGRRLKARR